VTSQYRSSSNPPSPTFATVVFSYGQTGGALSSSSQTGQGTPSNASKTGSAAGSASQSGVNSLVPFAVATAVAAGIGAAFLVLRARRKTQGHKT
jgi:hypothetical protein